ncbi:MAG: EamA family transporter [Eubacteriales bacterium]
MWLFHSVIGSVFSGAVPFLGKYGGKRYGQSAAAVIRGTVVLLCASAVLLIKGIYPNLSLSSLLFFLFAGFCDALAWYFYFRSLCSGENIHETVAVEKVSVAFTGAASALFFRTSFSFLSAILIVTGIGCVLSAEKHNRGSKTVLFAVLSALFASAQMILSKFGLQSDASSEVGFWIRSSAAFLALLILHSGSRESGFDGKHAFLSGLSLASAGLSAYFGWYFCYRALLLLSASSVQAILKLNFWTTALLSRLFTGERLTKPILIGYSILTAGILISCFT